ncbi:MAG: class II glutamine amidotransferase [Hyphomicrobiaceae bacterium]
MCELLAVSASAPVNVKLSLARLAAHGGASGNPDGWGVAFLDGNDAQIWRDPHSAASSPWVTCLGQHPISSRLVVAQIRHATQGGISLANTQPFARELWGRVHVFAHNGMLPGLGPQPKTARFQAIGETDSEAAFCGLMDRIAKTEGSPESIRGAFSATASRLRSLGPANLLFASGGRLLVHADRRTQVSGEIAPPGLWVLERTCLAAPTGMTSGAGVEVGGDALKVILVASVPLTEEMWRPLARGTILEVVDGAIVAEQTLA